MEVMEKLTILADTAKDDANCTSSTVTRAGKAGIIGNAGSSDSYNTVTAEGRCVTLQKTLITNH